MRVERLQTAAMLIAILLAAVLQWSLMVGSIGSDDLGAWYQAYEFSQGNWSALTDYFNRIATVRYGLSLGAAPFFAVFGVSESTSTLFPGLLNLASVAVACDIVRRMTGSLAASFAAGLALAASGLAVFCATVLLPDGPMAAIGLIALWLAIIAVETPDSHPMRQAALYAASGLMAGYAISIKEPGAMYAAALALWLVPLAILHRLRWPLLFGLVGFMLALAAELSFVWLLHGDPLAKVDRIQHTLQSIKEFQLREKGVVAPTSVGALAERSADILGSVARDVPWSFALVVAGALAAPVVVLQRRRDPAAWLLAIAMMIFVAMRLVELTQTFGYHPRRLLPGVQLGAILTAVAAAALLARVRPPLSAGAFALVGLAALPLVLMDLRYPQKQRSQLFVERGIVAWLQQNRAEAERVGFYADHRTIRIIAALMGYPKQADWLETYPVYWRPIPEGYEKPKPPIYGRNSRYVTSPELAGLVRTNPPRPDKGFWSVNPRYVRWVNRISRGQWFAAYATELPQEWSLVTIIPSSDSHDEDGKIYRIEGYR